MSASTDHDALFKELLTTYFFDFVKLFFPKLSRYLDKKSVVFLDKEIIDAGERREADLVAKARFRGREAFFLIHIENQARADALFPRRMFRYFSRLHEKHGIPVYPIAVFSYERPLRAEPECYDVAFPDLKVLSFKFRVVQLNRLNWRNFLRQRNPIASALMSRMAIATSDRPRVKVECLRLLATLRLDVKRSRLISRFVDSYLNLSAQENREFFKELSKIKIQKREETLMTYVTSWEREGIKKGRREEAQAMVMRLLKIKIGPINPLVLRRLRALSLKRSEELLEALLKFKSASDLDMWLKK